MKQKKQRLLQRLDAIGASLKESGHALALLGLGSVGLETERLDDYSDLDFFVIVKPGVTARYIDSLDWLTAICPLVYAFRNSVDGYKALFADGIFCEFAVFEAYELHNIPFTQGRLIWKVDSFDETLCVPQPISHERRYEVRYPRTAQYLPTFIRGYEHNVESALAILAFLEQHFEVNPAMSAAIREWCAYR
jgi:hypothetical protein